MIADEFEAENSLLSTVTQFESFIRSRCAQLVDFARLADVHNLCNAVYGAGVVRSDACAVEATHNGPLEEWCVDPLFKFNPREPDPAQLIFTGHEYWLLGFAACSTLCIIILLKNKLIKN